MSLFKRFQNVAGAVAQKAIRDLNEKVLKDTCLGHVGGVAVCDASLAKKSPELFFNQTRQAMALIETHDPRRYRRICRHLHYIVNQEIISVGSYERKLKICHVDYAKFFTSSNEEWNLRSYACLLIHEATHGVLEEKLILYQGDKRERIEGLCHLEEYRFARRLDPEWADTCIGPFQPENWKSYWEGTRRDRLAAWWKRIQENYQAKPGDNF